MGQMLPEIFAAGAGEMAQGMEDGAGALAKVIEDAADIAEQAARNNLAADTKTAEAIRAIGEDAGATPGGRLPRGAWGPASGREYDPNAAGGPIENLDASSANINSDGVQSVEDHLRRFVPEGILDPPEQVMLDRLKSIAADGIEPTQYDLNFYTHELREASRYAQLGYGPGSGADLGSSDMYDVWNNVHTATLEDYGLSGKDLYHPEAGR